MSVLDMHNDENHPLSGMMNGKALAAAIYEVYKEADRKREELIDSWKDDEFVVTFAIPSYKELSKRNMELSTQTILHINEVF